MIQPTTASLPAAATEILQSLAQHRVLTTTQIHAIHTPRASSRRARRLLTQLERADLAGHVHLEGARKLWHLTQSGADLLASTPSPAHQPPKVLTAQQAAGQLWRHTVAVNDVGIAFVNAARQRGDEFGALSWRHEIAHRTRSTGRRHHHLVADALVTYLLADGGEVGLEYRFLELDRATLTVDRLAAKLAGYARLYRERDQHGNSTWQHHYLEFPAILVVLADHPRRLLERRARSASELCLTDPELERTPEISILFCLLDDLSARGPFAPIFFAPNDLDQRVDWLGRPAEQEDEQ